jgi:hypothetical protein
MVSIVQLSTPEGGIKKVQCYVYDSPLGPTAKILLLSLQSVIELHSHYTSYEHVDQRQVWSTHFLDTIFNFI